MGAIAEGHGVRVFAGAPRDDFGFFDFYLLGFQAAAFV